jgi:DNA-binding NarL/FixJ family response regulator
MMGRAPHPDPTAYALLDRDGQGVVLVVDDQPDTLAFVHDALDAQGYTVLVATDGEAAIVRALQAQPDIVLLDAMLQPDGPDGFEVARRLKAHAATAHVPIIFMTGLTETEHLVAALDAGGVDYVTKPVKPRELLARMAVHRSSARMARQARNALDAFGYASVTVRASDGRILWQTPLARELLQRYFPGSSALHAPAPLLTWLRRQIASAPGGTAPAAEPPRLCVEQGARKLTLRLHRRDDEHDWIIVMHESSDAARVEAIASGFGLTWREAEVLYWVAQGKINRDIGDIVGASAATVKKHLEHVYAKLGVETRTAAAALALERLRHRLPQDGG